MNAVGTIFLLANAAALMVLPQRWAPLPLLAGACYMTLEQGIHIGSLNFPVVRILIAVGFCRVILKGERLAGRVNRLDMLLLAWAAWAVASSLLHEDVPATLVNRLGLVYNACGIYFLLRIFCRSINNVIKLCQIIAILLIPLSLAILFEHFTGHNLFSALGGVPQESQVRNGIVRAQGPFAHAILAGSVGAASLPMMFALWRRYRALAICGMAACLIMVYASASSGPILSAGLSVAAMGMWRWRQHTRILRWFAVLLYLALELVMNAPAYFVLARLSPISGSTSWHRAELIDTAIGHLPEWWLFGTDYTRHWMPYGVPWSGNHIDITNYYIQMGVYGGLPLMLLFVLVVAKGFSLVGRHTGQQGGRSSHQLLTLWALGVSLFTHSITFVSVSYFDQSVLFLYLTLAAICAASHGLSRGRVPRSSLPSARPVNPTSAVPTPNMPGHSAAMRLPEP